MRAERFLPKLWDCTARLSLVVAAMSVAAPIPARSAGSVPVEDRARAVECLTLAIAYEAGYESNEGQQAVAQVILNRVRSPYFPKTVCDVVFAGSTRRTGCQFTFTCDGSLYRKLSNRVMLTARAVAQDAIDGLAPSPVPLSTHYHASYVTPYWASSLVRDTKIGAHIFYHPASATAAGTPGAIALNRSVPTAAATVTAQAGVGGRQAAFAPWGLSPVVAGQH